MLRIKDSNKIPQILKELDELSSYVLYIGITGEEDSKLAMVASVQEYGITIPVTEKSRKYLHAMGLHLKNDTVAINIPERSFIRSTFDEEIGNIEEFVNYLFNQLLSGNLTAHKLFELVGEYCQSLVQRKIIDLDTPANHPYTVEQKRSSNPLIDTGHMMQNIRYKVQRR